MTGPLGFAGVLDVDGGAGLETEAALAVTLPCPRADGTMNAVTMAKAAHCRTIDEQRFEPVEPRIIKRFLLKPEQVHFQQTPRM
jgi:hypothetical protein